jgi:lipopolysaccharide/colanic/teichoic acid biosynthesis glycosyltransferase
MIVNADKSGVDSTSSSDNRITSLGRFIRKYKLDEITQLWNVLLGDMSLVGPRPNVKRETDLYTYEEKTLLKIKPGITDLASIVFADEGDILNGQNDPDIAYNQLIRPGKSHLGIFYVKHQTILLDIQLIFYTITLMFSREKTLKKIQNLLRKLNANDEIIKLASRTFPLKPMPPPGSSKIVTSRDGDPNK